jgi:hypothetical protein
MLTQNEIKHGFIDVNEKANPVKQHLFCITALRKMQEFIYETVGKDGEWEGLSDGEVVDGLVDYLDAILGKYEGSTPPPSPKDTA